MIGQRISEKIFGHRQTVARARKRAFMDGIRTVLPALVATGTWALVTGVAMVKIGMSQLEALGMTLLVYAGSAQLAALPLIAADAPVWVIVLTAAVVNLRFVIFSAGLYPYFHHFPLKQRLFLGYLTTDVGFALSVQRWTAQESPPDDAAARSERAWFFLGISAGSWVSWQVMSIAGIFLAGQVPGTWGLEFAAVLALIALTVPMVNSRPVLTGALMSCVVAIAASGFPLKLGLVTAVIAGIGAAMATELALEKAGRS